MYCWRSSSASANRNGSRPCSQNWWIVQKNGRTPVVRAPTSGVAFGSPRRGGASTATLRNALRRQAERGVARRLVVVELGVGVVEEQQVLALDVEDQGLGVGRLGAEHAGVEQRVQQERGVARLRGHAGDAGDVDVGALGAVDEVEVEEHRLAVAAEAGGQLAGDLVEVERGRRARRRRPGAPRCRAAAARTSRARSGSTWTSAASDTSAGSIPSAMRNTSLSKRAPSWRARTWPTMP